MKVYITRHGQIAEAVYHGDDAMFPAGDPPLSPLGREQARMLGEELRSRGFCGKILSSPYLRTLETAQIVAEYTGSAVYPFVPIRERMKTDGDARRFRGTELREIQKRFPAVAADAELSYPWWSFTAESYPKVKERVHGALSVLQREGEVLLVGHGATVSAVLSYYQIGRKPMSELYNCSLSVTDPEDGTQKKTYCDVSFMPYEKVTNNFRTRESMEAEYLSVPYPGEICLPAGLLMGRRYLLHIGDTPSRDYPYYQKLIALVKPQVIVHTGDMADEVKVGRIPGTEHEYLFKIGKLTDILRESGARRVIITSGNNDLPHEIQKNAPFAEVATSSVCFTEGRFTFCARHIGAGVPCDADFFLYGHSLRNETWSPAQNQGSIRKRLNTHWGVFIIDLDSGACHRVVQ